MTERRPWEFLTSGHLQIIALLTMTIDHTGALLFPGVRELRIIGRLAFPLYCLMIAEGFAHTSSRKKYFLRLLIFGFISIVPYGLFHFLMYRYSWDRLGTVLLQELLGNVLFELAAGFLALWGLSKGKAWVLLAPLVLLASEYLDLMYGWYGIAMIVQCYLFRKYHWAQAAGVAVLTLLEGGSIQIYAAFAAVLIFFYSGQRGRRLPRYLGYAYYPGHLAALDILHVFFH